MTIGSIKEIIRVGFNAVGLEVARLPHPSSSSRRLSKLYEKYKTETMLGPDEYVTNLALAASVSVAGCVIECGVWRGGTMAGMAEVLGADREYFLFDSFQGRVAPEPVEDQPRSPGKQTQADHGTSITREWVLRQPRLT